jgi:dephospho-CoA kinase
VVKDDFLSWAAERKGLVALESAILVEAGFLDVVDCVLLVEAPENLRLQRAMHRDGATEEQVRQRMARQASDEERRAASDFIIVNDGRDIQQQLSFFIESLLGQLSY